MFCVLFLAPYARTTRYEEAFLPLENQGKDGSLRSRASCWNAVIQCFQWFGTMLLLDTSFLLNVIIIHSVLLSMIRAFCCCCSALEWWVFFGQNKHFLYVQVPGVDIVRAKRVSNWYIPKKKICPCVCSTNLGFSVEKNVLVLVGYVLCTGCTWYQPAEITSCENHSMVVYIH